MNVEKTLWQRYGKIALFTVFLMLLASVSVQYFNNKSDKHAEEASVVYEKMMANIKKEDFVAAKTEADSLMNQYAKTPYSALAALMMSRVSVDKNDPKQAIELLNIALALGKKGPLEDIARIRLARVLLSEARYQEALAVLPDENKETGYTTLYEEVRGDIYFKQNELKKAKEAYAKAIKAAPPGVPLTSLQLKFTDLNVKEES